jgi:folate-dependent phosphoribosylglycinamide formyltransferase PurN
MRLGVVGSSGGAALQAADRCLAAAGRPVQFVVVADRDCGLLRWARGRPGAAFEVPYPDADGFSAAAAELFRREGVRRVLLLYTRRVAAPLIHELDVCNIHPALLPAFPGLSAVRQALAAGVRLLGATLHRVDEGLDTGPILAQIAHPLPPGATLRQAEKISYLQKVWLTLLWCGMDGPGGRPTALLPNACPALGDPALLAAFARLRAEETAALGFALPW